jgi:putative ABC transport system permease protein
MSGTLIQLAFAGIRARLLPSLLTVFLALAASATIVTALQVGATTAGPWQKTFDAAHGAHVLAMVPTAADARQIATMPGVTERDEPMLLAITEMQINGEAIKVFLLGLERQPTINIPIVTEGNQPAGDEMLVERSLYDALNLSPGARVTFKTTAGPRNLTVSGAAIVPSQPRYPRSNPGIAWVSLDTLRSIQPDQQSWRWLQAVRLADPSLAPAFAASAMQTFPPNTVSVESWQDQRDEAMREFDPFRIVLVAYTLLLLIVSVAVIAILIGARAIIQQREMSLLRAIGLSPRQVSALFVLEVGFLGIVGILLGFVPGTLLAPRLAAPAASTLLASPETEANPTHVLVAAAIVLPVMVWAAYVAARKSTRATVLQGVREGVLAYAPASRIVRLITWLVGSLPLMVGLRDLLARRARVRWLAMAIGLTAAALVVTLSIRAALDDAPVVGQISDVPPEFSAMIYMLDGVLAVILLAALFAVAVLSAQERTRDFAVLRSVGFTSRAVTGGFAGTFAGLAFVSAVLAIPVGLLLYAALFAASGSDSSSKIASAWELAVIPVVMAVVTAFATGVPARLINRSAIAGAIRHE